MTWRYVREDPTIGRWHITVAGRRVSRCLGFNEPDGKICVLIHRPMAKGPPAIMYHGSGKDRGDMQAYVRAPFYVGEQPPDILVPGWAYFTMKGWVNERGQPIEAPWEFCQP